MYKAGLSLRRYVLLTKYFGTAIRLGFDPHRGWVLLPYGGLANSWLKGGHTEVKQRLNGGFIQGLDAHYISPPMPSV